MAIEQVTVVMDVIAKMDKAEGEFRKLQGILQKLKLPDNLDSGFKKSFSNIESLFAKYKSQLEQGFDSKASVNSFIKTSKAIDTELDRLSKHFTELTGKEITFRVKSEELKQAEQVLKDLATAKEKFGQDTLKLKVEGIKKDELSSVKSALLELQRITKGNTGKAAGNILEGLNTGNIQQVKKGMDDLLRSFKNVKSEAKLIDIKKAFGLDITDVVTKIINALRGVEGEMDTFSQKSKTATENINQIKSDQITKAADEISQAVGNYEQLEGQIRQTTAATQEYARSTQEISRQLGELQQSTQYFFSLRNMINLFKRGIDDAIQSVKELDKAMTNTAVVTDYKVSDMWNMLPQYTQIANELGATTQGAYETMTLYFQQGLEAQQAFEIGAETMKMARIAGLDYAETTDMMTAALRGFNMELNEVSAKRINDVYSELAAITASDTEELGTAMQRTASIAHSAGMSFEGTTAFLAQAIETTREPAENIGTAMKTIVARFQEMKKNPLEIAEVDGEEVSYNKVDQALQSIGVSLKDTNGQFRELDQVFLDISQRWDNLSQTQQRYIATVAAGSRQQSRFIAMMDNYDRTMQLVEAANNSAGASDEQFGKTMDSLEAKLNKLHNAWQQFTMGIANNGMIKLFVDGMTGALNIVNKLIDTFSGGIGPLKSFMSIFAAFTGLKAAGRFANAMIGGLGGLIDPQKSFAEGLAQGITGNRQAVNAAQAHAISDPIVRAIYDTSNRELQNQNQSSQTIGAYSERDAFRGARQELLGYTKKGNTYNLKQLQNTLSGLSAKNQNILMRGSAGTAFNMRQSALNHYYEQLGNNKAAKRAIQQAERSLNNARAKGEITWEEYFKGISDPSIIAKAIDKTRNGAGAEVAEKILNSLNKSIIEKGDNAFTATAEKIRQEFIDSYSEQGYDEAIRDKYLASEQTQAYINAEAEKSRQAAMSAEIEKITAKNGGWANLLNQAGRFGTKMSEAGMSIQAFASILTSSANPALQTFGTVLSTVGGLFSGLGMGISGLSSTFTAVAESSAMTAMFGGAAAAATGWLFALAGAIAAIVALVKRNRAKTREDAEKVTTDFKDKSEKNQTNLVNLKEWQAELAVLSKGVDKNGLNVSLDSSDYQRYLEITQGIADINPDIIQGYNSQGHAIIDNNKALQETLDLERQHGKELIKNYTNTESWNKLLKARNLERYSMMSATDDTKIDENGNYGTIGKELKPRNQMRTEARSIARLLQGSSQYIDLSDIVDLDALSNGSVAEFNNFRQNFDVIRHRVGLAIEEAGEDWSEKSRNAILEGFSGFSTASDELNELVQPIYEMMSTYATDSIDFERMADPLKTGFQQVLKSIAENGNYEDDAAMRKAVDQQLKTFSNFSNEYQKIEKEIEKAQRDFADSQDEAAYQAAVHIDNGPIDQLKALKAEFENTPGGEALAEWVDNQIDRIEKRTFDGTASIAEAWDTLSDEVAAAEGAFQAFEDSIKSDYATAANNMKQIYEAATSETDGIQLHLEGFGDKTAWKAGEELFGDISGWGIKDLRKAFADFEPMLQDGQAGVEGFVSRVLDANSELEELAANSNGALELENGFFSKIDETLDPEIWSKVAETLGMSEQFLISMIQKAKQFFGIDTSNYDQIRTALGNDTNAIKGTKTTTYTDNEGIEHKNAAVYYMTDDDLRELMGAEYNSGAETKKEELSAKGIEVLPDIAKTSTEELGKVLKDGFEFNQKDQAAGIASLVDTFGQKYDSDSVLKMAQAYFGKGEDDEAFNQQVLDAYDHFWDNQEYPTLGPVQNIESLVSQIASSFNRDNIQNGRLNDEIKQSDDFKEAIFGKRGIDDSIANFFRKGLDENGKALTAESYGQNLAELNKIQAAGETYLADLRAGMAKAAAEGNSAQAQEYSKEIQNVEKYLTALNAAIESGTKKFEEGTSENAATENQSTSTASPNPYDRAEEEMYSRNTERGKQWWNDFWHSADDSKPETFTNTENNGLSRKEGGEGFQQNTETDSAISQAATGLTEAGTTLNEGGTTAFTGLQEAATSLNTAGQNLTNAAAILSTLNTTNGQSSQSAPGMPSNVPPNQQSSASGIVVVDNSPALASFEELQSKAQETKEQIEIPMSVSVAVSDAGLKKTADRVKTISDGAGDKSINVTANASDPTPVNELKAAVEEFGNLGDKTITATATLAGASSSSIRKVISAIEDFYKLRDDSVTLTTIHKNQATGSHNHGYVSSPSFGSAASGYGQLGPKGKGGLTLTGELGYEIAWLPSENRSMILGADGPQMINLPGDAVVWTHEQSKKILKQKAIPAGSHSGPNTVTIDDPNGIVNKVKGSSSSNKSSTKSSKKTSKSKSKSNSSNTKEVINNFSIEEVVRFNIDQNLTKLTNAIDNRTKNIEKTISKIGITYDKIVDATKEQATALQGVKNYNEQLLASYQRQLAYYRSRQAIVSYTDSAGNSQEKKINIADYLNADGTANIAAIQAAGDSALQEAIQKEISSSKSLVDGINSAQKAIKDAENQIAELGKKISETFYQWENELTEVYDLTQRIASATSFTDRFTSQIELELSKLNAGFGETARAIENTRIILTRSNSTIQEQIKNQQQMINARQRELEAAFSYEDEVNKLEKFKRQTGVDEATRTANIEWAQNLLNGAQLGSKYIKDIFKDLDGSIQYTIDWEQFNADNEANPYSKETYEAIKKYLDDVNNAATEFNNSIKEQTDFIKQTYDALKEYQSFVADMEDTLIQSYEEQIQTTIDNSKQLSESISNSLKDLLDEVKRKLDERRKQEDNAKTERDISQKQQRLAALRANTAGGNQVEIAKLEKEIADAQQSYGRTLEDQLLDRLQQQADEAQKQRERQIELAEIANELNAANNKELVDLWLKDPESYKEKIKAAWLEAHKYDEKGEAGQYILDQEFESQFTQLITAVEQSGFNNLEKPFTAIEDNTNTLVALLKRLTEEQIGISDESTKAFGSLADVTYRNTGTFRNGSNGTSNMGGMTLVSSNPKRANSGITLGKDSYVKKNAEYDESGEIKSYGQVVDSNTGITYDFAYDKNTGKNIYLDTGEISSKNSLGGLNMSKSEDAIYVGQVFDVASQGSGQNQKYVVKSIDPIKGKNGYTVTYEYTSRGGGVYRWSDSFYGDQLAFDNNTLSGVSDYVNSRQLLDVLNPADNKWYLLYKTLGGMNANEKDATYAVAGTGDANRLSKYSVSLDDLEWISDETGNYFKFKKWIGVGKKFKSGGLNTSTGPAWLDGTPSKPELVLNSTDTKNFLALRDVLSSAMKSSSAVSNTYGGDTTYEININVDKLTSDYDVDRVADRVKKIITKDASYRNVTQVRNFR